MLVDANLLKNIIEGVSNTYGEAFFSAITLQLDKVIQSDFTFIARFNREAHTSRTLALVVSGELVDNFEYALKGTPCDEILGDSVCIYPCGVQQAFPEDQLLVDMEVEGYVGAPLYDSLGDVMGLIVGLYKKPIQDEQETLTLFNLFSGRIGAEMERLDRHNELMELNKNLDQLVKERTEELENTIVNLTMTQEKLVEQEKMAALGDLVAGFAHEVNTPLGTAITAESMLYDELKLFRRKIEQNQLSKSYADHFLSTQQDCLQLIKNNLARTSELIENFKMLAQDQSESRPVKISLNDYYQRLLFTLKPLLDRKNVQVIFTGCEVDNLVTYPGCHAQLLTYLINNSIQHGFLHDEGNVITISIERDNIDQHFHVHYRDNGIGMKPAVVEKAMDPFFTTARGAGNVGLGLSISYNLAVNSLRGSFSCMPNEHGAHFEYEFIDLA